MVQKALLPGKVTRDALNSLVDRAADLIRTVVLRKVSVSLYIGITALFLI